MFHWHLRGRSYNNHILDIMEWSSFGNRHIWVSCPHPAWFICGIWYCRAYNTAATTAWHYNDVIMGTIASQITSITIVYSTVYSDADQKKYQSSTSLAFVRGIHRGPVNSPHKWPVTRKMFPFDDVIMSWESEIYYIRLVQILFEPAETIRC